MFIFAKGSVASWILMFFFFQLSIDSFLFCCSVGQSFHYQSAAAALIRARVCLCVWVESEDERERVLVNVYVERHLVWSCSSCIHTGIFVVVVCVRIVHAAAAAAALRFQPLFSTVFSRCTQRKVRLTIILRNYIYFLRGFSLLALFLKLNNF